VDRSAEAIGGGAVAPGRGLVVQVQEEDAELASFVAGGLLTIAGAVLLRRWWPAGRLTTVAVVLWIVEYAEPPLYLGAGVGGMERIAGYPANLWVLMIGIVAVLNVRCAPTRCSGPRTWPAPARCSMGNLRHDVPAQPLDRCRCRGDRCG
jgi:hypothetical protein